MLADDERPGPSRVLRGFMGRATGAALLVISVVSGLLAILEAVDPVVLLVAAVAALALCGWTAAFYVAFSQRLSTSRAESALSATVERLPIPYLETWLRATLFNPTAMGLYWQANEELAIKEIDYSIVFEAHDADLRVRFAGENAARSVAESCPMLMFGGSVIHLGNFPQNAVMIPDEGEETALHIQGVLDLGQIHFVQMLFPVPLQRGQRFTVEHRHSWPGGMTDGEDTVWFPYAALFRREATRMKATLTFARPPLYVKGMRASLGRRSCEPTLQQPEPLEAGSATYTWVLDPVDNDAIYGLDFETPV